MFRTVSKGWNFELAFNRSVVSLLMMMLRIHPGPRGSRRICGRGRSSYHPSAAGSRLLLLLRSTPKDLETELRKASQSVPPSWPVLPTLVHGNRVYFAMGNANSIAQAFNKALSGLHISYEQMSTQNEQMIHGPIETSAIIQVETPAHKSSYNNINNFNNYNNFH